MTTINEAAERERPSFEAAFADKLDFLRLSPDAEYFYSETGHAWDGWQARSTLPQASADASDDAAATAIDSLIMAGERKVREMLVDLHREYQRRADPLIKHLVAIEATKPSVPFALDWMLTSCPAPSWAEPAPEVQASHGALTDDQIDALMAQAMPGTRPSACFRKFARLVEASHAKEL